jgi:hypothetical protein
MLKKAMRISPVRLGSGRAARSVMGEVKASEIKKVK